MGRAWECDDFRWVPCRAPRLSFKEEGAGKVRVFAITFALMKLLRPAHDWLVYEDLASHPM